MSKRIKGDEFLDHAWNDFLCDIRNNDMVDILGIDANGFNEISMSSSKMVHISQNQISTLRATMIGLLTNMRSADSEVKNILESLFNVHADYCKRANTIKRKRIHNVLAYRYTGNISLSNRMIGRKLGKCKEEIDADWNTGIYELLMLSLGIPMIIQDNADSYDLVYCIVHNYFILDESLNVDISSLIKGKEEKNIIAKSRADNIKFMNSFYKAFEIYKYFCKYYSIRDQRRIDVVNSRFIKERKSIDDLVHKYNVCRSTIERDLTISIKRIADLMFQDGIKS